MRCPKCHSIIRRGIKFCEECGSKLETTCPACSATIPLGTKFCGECGSRLCLSSGVIPGDISFEDKLIKIQKYLPKGLTEKILSQKEKIEGERKQVTVLFCDMHEFTPLVERVGAEIAFSIRKIGGHKDIPGDRAEHEEDPIRCQCRAGPDILGWQRSGTGTAVGWIPENEIR